MKKKQIEHRELTFQELMSHEYKNTLIPEIIEFLGPEATLKFLQVFGGIRVRFPKSKDLLLHLRNLDIYNSVARDPGSSRVRASLASKYSLQVRDVSMAFNRMKLRLPTICSLKKGGRHSSQVRVTDKRNVKCQSKNLE